MTFTPTTHFQPNHFDPSLSARVSGCTRIGGPGSESIAESIDVFEGEPIQLRFAAFRFELASERLWCGEREIPLKPKMRDMLLFFLRHPQRLIAKAELLAAIWGGTHVSPETLRSSLRELRQVLEDDARTPRFVETVHARGYRFVCEVVAERSGSAPASRPSASTCRSQGRAVNYPLRVVDGTSARFESAEGSDPRIREIADRLRRLAHQSGAHDLADALADCADLLDAVADATSQRRPIAGR